MAQRFKAPVEIDVDKLLLDEQNPRIPPNKQSLSQDDLAKYVAEAYNALAIAKSITAHQYFPSEPLIAIPTPRKVGYYTVVEGNRRLAALKLLLKKELREQLVSHAEWDSLPTDNVPQKAPVVVVDKRRDVAPIIGYRHISGIQPWDAHAKARYIAAQVESGLTFAETAEEVGESEPEVRMNYRNYRISEQIESNKKINPEALSGLKAEFGVFTRAMQSPGIREFIGAPSTEKVTSSKKPIPKRKSDALKEMVEMLFGSSAVLKDSRDITRLGKIVTSKEGLKVLRKERNLTEAEAASGGERDRLLKRLTHVANNLRIAKDNYKTYKRDGEVKRLLEEIEEALKELKNS